MMTPERIAEWRRIAALAPDGLLGASNSLRSAEAVELLDAYEASQRPKSQYDPAHTCAVCRVAWVDSDNGFDTCASCVGRV